jgi:hypothetical protein
MKTTNKATWAIGGGLLTGTGFGFFYIQQAPLVFVGCIISGLGLGLIITAILSVCYKN